jgi:hypothetical protein
MGNRSYFFLGSEFPLGKTERVLEMDGRDGHTTITQS